MKFSNKKKRKMRKIRYKRNLKTYGSSIGRYYTLDGFTILDTILYKGQMYFLGSDGDENYKIIKVVSVHEHVPLSDKKVLKKKNVFGNPDRWNLKTKLIIDNTGKVIGIESDNSESSSKCCFASIVILMF